MSAEKALDGFENYLDEMMEKGMKKENLTDMLFERFWGRDVLISTTNMEIIKGHLETHFNDERGKCLSIKMGDGTEREIYRDEVKMIKAFPID